MSPASSGLFLSPEVLVAPPCVGLFLLAHVVPVKCPLLAICRLFSVVPGTPALTPITDIRKPMSAFRLISSALPPITDVNGWPSFCLQMTHSGHSRCSAHSHRPHRPRLTLQPPFVRRIGQQTEEIVTQDVNHTPNCVGRPNDLPNRAFDVLCSAPTGRSCPAILPFVS
jgi:hypothetical protein